MAASTRSTAVLVVALLAGVLCLASAGSLASASHGATNVTLGNASATPGSNVTVTLTAHADNVSSYEASVTYDPSVVRVAAVEGGDFSRPITNDDADAGRLNLTQVNVQGIDDPTLARITFEIVGQPGNTTALAFDDAATALYDGDSEEIRIDTYSDGTVSVDQPLTPSPTATRTETASGATPAPGTTARSTETEPTAQQEGTTRTTAGTGPQQNDGTDDSSLLGLVFDGSFLLGAGAVVFVLLVGGAGYYLGSRDSEQSARKL